MATTPTSIKHLPSTSTTGSMYKPESWEAPLSNVTSEWVRRGLSEGFGVINVGIKGKDCLLLVPSTKDTQNIHVKQVSGRAYVIDFEGESDVEPLIVDKIMSVLDSLSKADAKDEFVTSHAVQETIDRIRYEARSRPVFKF